MTVPDPSSALVLLDYQVALCQIGPHCRAPALAEQVAQRGVLARAATVLATARQAGCFVLHVRLAFDPSFELRTNRTPRFDTYPADAAMVRGSAEAEIVAPVAPARGEPVLDKGCVDPFIGSPLAHVLHARGIRRVLFGGVATNLVVESAARHAADIGLRPVVIEDLCASFEADLHDFAISRTLPLFAQVVGSAEILSELAPVKG